jgi:hypothetical protein
MRKWAVLSHLRGGYTLPLVWCDLLPAGIHGEAMQRRRRRSRGSVGIHRDMRWPRHGLASGWGWEIGLVDGTRQ